MKKIILAMAVILTLAAGCSGSYESLDEAERGGAVIGENIFIDGFDVSGMDAGEARALMAGACGARIEKVVLSVHAGEKRIEIGADELGVSFDVEAVLLQALNESAYQPLHNGQRAFFTTAGIDLPAVSARAERAAAALMTAPVDAAADFNGQSFVYTEHSDGLGVDAAALAKSLAEAALSLESADLAAPTYPVPALYTGEDARADTALVAKFSTSFSGSTLSRSNRVFNIVKAAGLIDGARIDPGEEFDVNAALGPRNGKTGWREAPGIRDGQYVPEYGGGVCQVSTTLYNAVLLACLEITERKHHSWPMGYADIGRDATISTGGPNLRFVNSSGAPLYIRAHADKKAKRLTVELYGRPIGEGVTVKLWSKKVKNLDAPGSEKIYDASLPEGDTVEERKARRGAIAETYREYYASDGELIARELVSRDTYRSIKGRVRVGTAKPSAAETSSGMGAP